MAAVFAAAEPMNDRPGYLQLCEQLWDDVGCGPGENPEVLRRVGNTLGEILADAKANAYVQEKAFAVKEQFEIWLSPRRWNKAKDGGSHTKMILQQDIAKLKQACQTILLRD